MKYKGKTIKTVISSSCDGCIGDTRIDDCNVTEYIEDQYGINCANNSVIFIYPTLKETLKKL
jgi:hypothetical protein